MSSYEQSLNETLGVIESLRAFEPQVAEAARCCVTALRNGRKLLICGNGGSAAEAQHLAGELMGRYKKNRLPLAAVALTADSALLTCIGNDYSYDDIFARQVQGLGRAGDILIAFTTSGSSSNVLKALGAARELGVTSIAFLGRDGGKSATLADMSMIVRHPDTARAQEGHQFLMHSLMDAIESGLSEETN